MVFTQKFKLNHAISVYQKMKALLDPREVKTAESRFFSKATIMEVSHPVASYYASFGTRYTKVVVDDLPFSMERKIWVDGLKIAFKDHGHMTGWWERPDGLRLKELKELAKPASFGRGSETVFDKDIRDGLEITADRIGIDEPDSTGIEAYELELAKMLQKYAPLGKKLQPKLYKMHIYCEGGHFKQHRDSLHAKNHYATLIIPLSSGYSGGELVFHDGGEQRSHKPYVGEFILFHTDVVHEVLPVTSTHPRVTLQFDVYLEDNKDPAIDVVYNPHNSASEANYEFEYKEKLGADPSYPSDKMMSDFVFHLRDFVAAHPNDNVCFLLTHKYPLVMDEANLKGEDLELYELLTKNGFNVKTTFVRERVTFYDSDEIDETHDTRHELEVMSYKQQQRLLQEILEQDELSTPNAFRTDQANDEKNDESEKTFLFLGSSAQFQFSKEKIYNPFTGNCPEEAEYVYVSIALTIVN